MMSTVQGTMRYLSSFLADNKLHRTGIRVFVSDLPAEGKGRT